MTRRSHAALILVIVTALVVACGPGQTPEPPEDVAHYTPEGPGGDAAQLSGLLERDDGCVYVVDPVSSMRTIPAFPNDRAIRWDDEVLQVGSRALTLGGTVDLAGGEGGAGLAGMFIPESCDPSAPVFIVSF